MNESQEEKMNEPLVSIIMPTYNQEQFIGKAISTVIEQSYKHWELIIINNVSTDKTRDVVESFRDERIQFIDFSNRGIIAASRNLGIKKSRGQLIAFLDSDDYWHPEKLQACIDKIKSGCDLVCHGEYFFRDGNDEFVSKKYGPEPRCDFIEMLTRGNCLSTSAIVVKKTILDQIGLFDESASLVTAEDFDLWLRAAQMGAKIGIIDSMLGFYRLHSGSASASNLKNAKATLSVLKKDIFNSKLDLWTAWRASIFRCRIRFFIFRNSSGFFKSLKNLQSSPP